MNLTFLRSRRFFTIAAVAGGVLVLAGGVFAFTRGGERHTGPAQGATTPTPVATPGSGARIAQPLADQLKAQVQAGKLDQSVLDELTAKGEADGLVVLDDERALERLRKEAAARGFTIDDERAIELKPVIYAEIKRQVAQVAPEHARTVEDFESFGVARVHFTSAQALLETVKRPEIAGVREIQQYTRPS